MCSQRVRPVPPANARAAIQPVHRARRVARRAEFDRQRSFRGRSGRANRRGRAALHPKGIDARSQQRAEPFTSLLTVIPFLVFLDTRP